MDSFELNKILGWVLFTCLATLALNISAGAVFTPHKPAKPGYDIAVPEEAAQSAAGEGAPAGGADQPIGPLLASADPQRGQASAKVCQTCHTFGKGEPNKVGPNLYGVVNREKAARPGFNYSAALKAKGGNWTFDDLSHFIAAPKGYAPGTAMGFAGVGKPNQRADIIAYLNSLSDSPAPLPQAAEAGGAPAPSGETPKGSSGEPPKPAPPAGNH